MESLCRYLTFLRFRNSAKYREILQWLREPAEDHHHEGIIYPAYGPIITDLRRRIVLREFIRFLQRPESYRPRDPRPEHYTSTGTSLGVFRDAMDMYCWRLCGAEVCIGIASEDQEFIFPDSCFGTLGEGFDENP